MAHDKRWLIATKLSPPLQRGDAPSGHRLHKRFAEAARHRLCIINAIAGYGKTTLMADWHQAAADAGYATGWLSLDEFDREKETLFTYVLAMASAALPENGDLEDLLDANTETLSARSLAAALIEALETAGVRVCLFLDDFHRAETDLMNDLLHTLIQYGPANLSLFIATRSYPRLGVAHLRTQGQAIDFQTSDLMLSPEDIVTISAGHLAPEDAALLQQHTEGWPIACSIACYLMRTGDLNPADLHTFSGTNTELSGYISEQVFNSLNEEEQTFLTLASVAERFSGDLIAHLDTSLPAWRALDSLLSRKVILSPLDSGGQWYRCHQVLADYLYRQLLKRHGTTVEQLHSRASTWFFDNGLLREAVPQAIRGKNYEQAAQQLDASGGWRLAFEGKLEFVRQFMDLLPEDVVDRHPRLFMAHLAKLVREGDAVQARRQAYAFKLKSDAFTNIDGRTIPLNIRTELDVIVDVLLDMYADTPTTAPKMAFLASLLDRIDQNDKTLLSIVYECLMRQHLEQGDLAQANHCLTHLKRLDLGNSKNSIYAFAYQCIDAVMIAVAEIRLREAKREIDQAKDLIARHPTVDFNLQAAVSVFEAEIAYLQNDLATASFLIDSSLTHLEKYDAGLIHYAPAFLSLFGITLAQGDRQAMDRVINRACAIAGERRLPRLQTLIKILEIKYLAMIGAVDEALHAARDIDLEGLAEKSTNPSDLSVFIPDQATLALARLYRAADKPDRALTILAPLVEKLRRQNRLRMLMEAELLAALSLFRMGNEQGAADKIRQISYHAMHENFTRPFIDEGSAGARLYEHTLSLFSASENNRYFSRFLKQVAEDAAREERRLASQSPGLAITNLEYQVVEELVKGRSNKEISRTLNVSEDTVKYRLKKVFRKWDVSTRAEAAKFAQSHLAQRVE